MKYFAFVFVLMLLAGCGSSDYPPLKVVDSVDVQRYLGKWHEIARLPNSFQEDCYCTTAEYKLIDNETIRVINRCREESTNGEIDEASGKAFIVEGSNNAKLKVQFFWPFRGDYWIIELDQKDYNYAVVGTPSREYLWILCRQPVMQDSLLNDLISSAKGKGFDTSKLIISNQDCTENE